MASRREGEKDEKGKREKEKREGEEREGEEREGKGGERTHGEHDVFGPLDIKRHIKDDGRTLILYSLRERKDEP